MTIELEGKKAPAFTLLGTSAETEGDEGTKIKLSDFKGKYVVVYFYPRDNTPGCTNEAKDFRDTVAELEELGAVVLGVSKDSIKSHHKFRDKYELNFPLLSDPEGKMLEKYGAWGEKKNYGKTYMGIIRSTVVVDPKGKVVAHFPKVRVKGHVEKVVAAIRAHQDG